MHFGPPEPLRSHLMLMGAGPSNGGAAFVGALDGLSTGLFAAFSPRRLFATFLGSPQRMRIQPGTTEADIGFNTTFDDVNATERAALLGSSEGRLVTYYNQVGSNDATMATAATQPQTKDSGGVITINGKQALKSSAQRVSTPSISHGIGTGDFLVSMIILRGASGFYQALGAIGNYAPSFYSRGSTANAPTIYTGVDRSFNTALTAGQKYVLTFGRESGTLKCWVNGVQEATTHAYSTSIASAAVTLMCDAASGGNNTSDCLLEAVFGTSLANRAAIIANQMTYAGL